MGQYLRPTPQHLPVVEYITPEQFESLRRDRARKKDSNMSPPVRSCAAPITRPIFIRSSANDGDAGRVASIESSRRGHSRLSRGKTCRRRRRSGRGRSSIMFSWLMTAQLMRPRSGARSAAPKSIVHPQNRGKGESIKTGLRHWLERGMRIRRAFSTPTASICRKRSIAFCRSAASQSNAKILIGTRMNDVARCRWCGGWSIVT